MNFQQHSYTGIIGLITKDQQLWTPALWRISL